MRPSGRLTRFMDKTDYQISNKRTKKNSSNPSRIGTNSHILLSPDGCDGPILKRNVRITVLTNWNS